jgi:hypothetical protein
MNDKLICEVPKNSRETLRVRLGEYQGHKFVDLRVFVKEDGKEPVFTKKGIAVSPALWPQFRKALAQAEAAMIEQGWLDKEDMETQE